jgi:hypothetical protein
MSQTSHVTAVRREGVPPLTRRSAGLHPWVLGTRGVAPASLVYPSGNGRSNTIRNDWDAPKENIVLHALQCCADDNTASAQQWQLSHCHNRFSLNKTAPTAQTDQESRIDGHHRSSHRRPDDWYI